MVCIDENAWLTQLAESPRARFWKVAHDELSPAERVFVCVRGFEADVEDGGFLEYFANASEEHATELPSALMAIGARATSDLAARAIAVVGEELFEIDEEERERLLERMSGSKQKKLDKLTEELLARPDDLSKCLYAYVKAHAKEIAGAE